MKQNEVKGNGIQNWTKVLKYNGDNLTYWIWPSCFVCIYFIYSVLLLKNP